MIRVLHIFGKMNRGGAEMRTLEIMPYLKEKGIHFDFCTLGDGAGVLDEKVRQLGGQVFNCPLSVGMRQFSRNFCELLTSGRYDAVHSHVYYFSGKILQLARRAGVRKRIAHFRSLHDGKAVTWKRKIYHAYMKFLIDRCATDILAVCKGVMDSSWKRWASDSRCRVIYNGVDLSAFDQFPDARQTLCRELGIPESLRILIHVGSFQTAKAHDVLLEAMKYIAAERRDVRLLLAGTGDLQSQMQEKARELGISDYVVFLGLRSDIPRLLKAADCFMLSSRREGLPGVVIEALAAGLPVAATDLPGVREIAGFSKNVSIVPPEDPAALSQTTLTILRRLDCQAFVPDAFPVPFDLAACVDAFYDLYSQTERC